MGVLVLAGLVARRSFVCKRWDICPADLRSGYLKEGYCYCKCEVLFVWLVDYACVFVSPYDV